MTNEKKDEVPSQDPKKPEIPTRKPDEVPPIDIPEKPGSDDQEGDEPVLPERDPDGTALPKELRSSG